MLSQLILYLLLMLGALMLIVPAVTDNGVVIRQNSLVRGVLALIVIALTNNIFWHVLVLSGISLSVPTVLLTMGVIAWLANSLAIFTTGRIMPGVLYVRSFGSAMGASLVLILTGWVMSFLLS